MFQKNIFDRDLNTPLCDAAKNLFKALLRTKEQCFWTSSLYRR